MPSAAEQLAANFNFGNFGKAKELRQPHLLHPGRADRRAARHLYPDARHRPGGAGAADHAAVGGGLLDVFNTFWPAARCSRMAIFALGIMPYISASIIIQLMTTVFPELEALKKEGEAGRKVINQYTRYGTVALAAIQAYGIAIGLEHSAAIVVIHPGLFFRIGADDHADRRHHPADVDRRADHQPRRRQRHLADHLRRHRGALSRRSSARRLEQARTGATNPLLLICLRRSSRWGWCGFIVFMERAQRRLFVTYPKRQVGNKVYGGESSHLPLKLNVSGVIPPIFASSILLLPTTIASFNAAEPAGLAADHRHLSQPRPAALSDRSMRC